MAQVSEESCASCSQAEHNTLQAHLLFPLTVHPAQKGCAGTGAAEHSEQHHPCVTGSLCSTHKWQLHNLCFYYEFVPLHCFPLFSLAKMVSCVCWACLVQEGKLLQDRECDFLPPACIKQKGAIPTSSQCHQTALLCSTVGNSTAPACFPSAPVCLLNVISNVYSLQGRIRLILAHG